MKKSIRGNIKAKTQEDRDAIVQDINKYTLWRLDTSESIDETTGESVFNFEAWVNSESDETKLWSDMKRHCDKHKGKLDRHNCNHDEEHKTPCVIDEEYKTG
ncbi:hypothetical protein [Bacillus sp. T33-2]|uniref:hypothetical protein n=1 Tax=Bacillus sp. T33-2 TaxID=2054168 RepID=UPI000C775E18|nr:hypothetical protein [Bacillus sp. T33-2]PLR93179.1 hypothetical protein CVD19_19420 [Bacillus sp. T33-2]